MNIYYQIKQKIDIANEVKVSLEMQDEYFDFYEYNNFEDFTDDQINDILGETDIDTLMRYITVDEDSFAFSHTDFRQNDLFSRPLGRQPNEPSVACSAANA